MSFYREMCGKMPYYPILSARMIETAYAASSYPPYLEITPDEFKDKLEGRKTFTCRQKKKLQARLGRTGFEIPLRELFYHPDPYRGVSFERLVDNALRGVEDMADDGPHWLIFENTMDGTDTLERRELMMFLTAMYAHAIATCKARAIVTEAGPDDAPGEEMEAYSD